MESSPLATTKEEPDRPTSSPLTDEHQLLVLRAVAELRHPHLAPVRPSAGPTFVLDPGAGISLAEICGDGPLPLRLQVRLLLDALSGLAALHQAKLNGKPLSFVHGEFAPHNILVGRDGIARLIPLVKAHWTEPPVPSSESLGYVAPERLLGDVFDQRADIFSAGVLLWEALAGRGLFGSLKMDAVVTKLVGSKVFRPAAPADAPWAAALADVAMQAISVDPADRWSHVGVMGAEIETITEGCLASSEEIAQMMRRRAHGERYAPPAEVLPVVRSSTRPSTHPTTLPSLPVPVREEPSAIALTVRRHPSVPDLGEGVISWSGPRTARQASWTDEPSTEADSSDVGEPEEPRFGPRPSLIGWAAIAFGVLSAIAAFMLFKREPSSEVVAEVKPVSTQIVLAPKTVEPLPAPTRSDVTAPPASRPPLTAQGTHAAPTRPSSQQRSIAAAAPPTGRSSTPPAAVKVPEPVAPPPAVKPAEPEPPPAPKPKEDLFGI